MMFRRVLCVSGLVCAAAWGGCSSDEPTAEGMPLAGASGSPTLQVDNPGNSAGKSAAGSGGTHAAGSGGSGGSGGSAAGSGGAAGAAGGGAGSGGSGGAGGSAAGSGGSSGSSAGAGGAAGSSGDPFQDLFGGLFGTPQLSCDGLLCLEDADCATLYPDETAACKLTRCVDFFCK